MSANFLVNQYLVTFCQIDLLCYVDYFSQSTEGQAPQKAGF